MPPNVFPIVLVAHIALAVSLFLPSTFLPFALRARRTPDKSTSPTVRVLFAMQTRGTALIGLGLAFTGLALVSTLGLTLLGQPWLLVGLLIYAANLVVAFFIQRPSLRSLLAIRAGGDDRVWAMRARRQRYVSYVMAGMIGTIGFLMSTKPVLW